MCKRDVLMIGHQLKWRVRRFQYTFTLQARDIVYWDEGAQGWRALSGSFGVSVSASDQDLALTGSFVV